MFNKIKRNEPILFITELESNWQFLVEIYATFAPMGIPSLAKFKAGNLLLGIIHTHPPMS